MKLKNIEGTTLCAVVETGTTPPTHALPPHGNNSALPFHASHCIFLHSVLQVEALPTAETISIRRRQCNCNQSNETINKLRVSLCVGHLSTPKGLSFVNL